VFFDDYPRFHKTSQVAASAARLNLRYEAIFAANRDILERARVLDVACNDGRWSFAALKSGASHVVGIEARPELCENATQTMEHYGVDPAAYEFVCGDVLDRLREMSPEVDVALCLGYLYHTYRHTELLHHLRRLDPEYLILDTLVIPGETRPVLQVKAERPFREGAAVLDPYAHDGRTLVTLPSLAAVVKLVNSYGFGVEHLYDWPALLAANPRNPAARDYATGRRVTLCCRTGVANIDLPAAPPVAEHGVSAAGAEAPPPGGDTTEQAEQPEQSSGPRPAWRHVLNRGLSRTVGYQLTRTRR